MGGPIGRWRHRRAYTILSILFSELDDGSGSIRTQRPQRHGAGHGGRGRRPNVRMVLLKGVDANGFVFYSNAESAKGGELAANPHAALNFHWKSLRKAVRVRGTVARSQRTRKPMPILPRGPRTARSAPGPRPSRVRWKAALHSRKSIAEYAAKYALTKVPRPHLLDRLAHHAVGDRILARPAVPPA